VLSLSADQNAQRPEETGIIWATHPTGCKRAEACNAEDARKDPTCWCDANVGVVPGILRAFDAYHLDALGQLKELWNSEQDLSRADRLGQVAKFTPVTVANGKVYAATFADPPPGKGPAKLVVYGIIPSRFVVTAPKTARAFLSFPYKVTALDDRGNIVPSYTGVVHFSSSDSAAAVPLNSTLANGVGTFSAILRTVGNQTITATDTVRSHVTGTTATIAVSASQ
jgi:hypothetical protein